MEIFINEQLFPSALLTLTVADAFLAALPGGMVLAGLVRIHSEPSPFPPPRLAETRKLDDVRGQRGVGMWELTPAGAVVLEPLAGQPPSPDPAAPLLSVNAPGSLTSSRREVKVHCSAPWVASIPGRADSAVVPSD